MIIGTGTAVNVATVLTGSGVGVLAGNRLPSRTRDLVTDALGLVTLLIAALSAVAVNDPDLAAKVGPHAPLLIVLGSLVIGGIVGRCCGSSTGSSPSAAACSSGWPAAPTRSSGPASSRAS